MQYEAFVRHTCWPSHCLRALQELQAQNKQLSLMSDCGSKSEGLSEPCDPNCFPSGAYIFIEQCGLCSTVISLAMYLTMLLTMSMLSTYNVYLVLFLSKAS